MGDNREEPQNHIKNLAIIPAKGDSKSVPRKNALLLPHTIEIAQRAFCVDEVVVSTDDAEIARIAWKMGAEVIWRPGELCTDTASSESALLHVLEHIFYEPEYIIFLQCTAPLTLPIDIDNCFMRLIDEKGDMAFTVALVRYNLWDINGAINHDPSYRKMRQEQAQQFLETGAVYIMKTRGFREAKNRFFGKIVYSVMPRQRCLEIDEPEDLDDPRLHYR